MALCWWLLRRKHLYGKLSNIACGERKSAADGGESPMSSTLKFPPGDEESASMTQIARPSDTGSAVVHSMSYYPESKYYSNLICIFQLHRNSAVLSLHPWTFPESIVILILSLILLIILIARALPPFSPILHHSGPLYPFISTSDTTKSQTTNPIPVTLGSISIHLTRARRLSRRSYSPNLISLHLSVTKMYTTMSEQLRPTSTDRHQTVQAPVCTWHRVIRHKVGNW